MPDRKKVIKGLECCTNSDMSMCLYNCPYHTDGCSGGIKMMRDALALLREQETVEPVIHCKDANLSNGADFACSGCGGSFLHKVVNFCPWCGKKVKWGE